MTIPTVKSLMTRYLSFFSLEEIKRDKEIKEKILEWIDRDLAWIYSKLKTWPKDMEKPRNTKMIIDFVGTAKQLNRIVNLRK